MKIAIIANQVESLINFRAPLMAEMITRGHEVIAFAPDLDKDSLSLLSSIGVSAVECDIDRSSVNPIKEVLAIFKLSTLLRKHKPDLCFGYFVKPVIYGTIAATLARVPFRYGLYAGLGYAFTDGEELNAKRRILQSAIAHLARFSSKFCSKIMVQNPDDLQELVSRRIADPAKIALTGATGIDLKIWKEEPIPELPLTFIMASRLLRDKGIYEYVAAARLIKRDHAKVRFIIIGRLDENPTSIKHHEINEWVSEGTIEWPGHVSAKNWISQAHVFVLPSYREGVPRSTQEAMALGRAIITTNVPGCRETVIDGCNGFMVPPRDPLALSKAMRHFIENFEDIAKMGAESRRLAQERFDVHRQNERLLKEMNL